MGKTQIELIREYYETHFVKNSPSFGNTKYIRSFFDDMEQLKPFNDLSEFQIRALSDSIGFAVWQLDTHKKNIFNGVVNALHIPQLVEWLNNKLTKKTK